ncbi:MAG: hemerythrin family protein [Sulfuritalea sp.]|nr:hemerythrin family protein [Sulfuritalea sp.]
MAKAAARMGGIMKDITWSKILAVGVEEIDDDHRKLVGIFNELNRAVREGESADYRAATLTELINCTVWHFSHEDRLMLKHHYPEIARHREAHRELIEAAQELQAKLAQADTAVANTEIEFLERWLTEHILTADQRLGSFLAQAM